MSAARLNLYRGLASLESALDSDLTRTKPPSETLHNSTAQLIRNGLAVTSFALLEAFIKSRSGEILQRLGQGAGSAVPFARLPIELQEAAIHGVLDALVFQRRVSSDKNYFRQIIQEHAQMISSTKESAYIVSPYALGHDQSNISTDTIDKVLRAFKVDNPWSAVGGIARRCGTGIPDLRANMATAAQRRHQAAHQADSAVEHTDLRDFALTIRAISIAVDLLLSLGLAKIRAADTNFLGANGQIKSKSVALRFVRPSGTKWAEISEGASKATKLHARREDAIASALGRAQAKGESLVVYDSRFLPLEWHTPAVD